MEDEDKMLPDWLREFKMRNIPAEYLNKFKEDTLLKYENEIDRLTKKLDDVQQYIEHKKVCGKSTNFSDAELITNEIMNELEEILYWEE